MGQALDHHIAAIEINHPHIDSALFVDLAGSVDHAVDPLGTLVAPDAPCQYTGTADSP